MNFKGKGTIIRTAILKIALYNRRRFTQALYYKNLKQFEPIFSNSSVQIDLNSFSSHADLAEQFLSILSFIRYCGKPQQWIVFSDGTHTKEDLDVLSFFPFVKVVFTPFNCLPLYNLKPSLQKYFCVLKNYANLHALGKKLLVGLNYQINSPTIFLDSDILFYKKANSIINLQGTKEKGFFLRDVSWGNLDDAYLSTHLQQPYQANSGFYISGENLCCEEGLQHLESLQGRYHYFSEQTVMHIIFKANGMKVLDPESFFIDTSDQFKINYNFKRDEIALRHYVHPVRYKMWQRSWKWHLQVSE